MLDREWCDGEEGKKRCVVVVVQMDAICVRDRTQCPSCSLTTRYLALASWKPNEPSVLSFSSSLSLSLILLFYRSRGILFYGAARRSPRRHLPAAAKRRRAVYAVFPICTNSQSAQFRSPTRSNWQRERYAANHAAGIKRRKGERNGRL